MSERNTYFYQNIDGKGTEVSFRSPSRFVEVLFGVAYRANDFDRSLNLILQASSILHDLDMTPEDVGHSKKNLEIFVQRLTNTQTAQILSPRERHPYKIAAAIVCASIPSRVPRED